MKELTPRDMENDLESSEEHDELWSEAMSALGLIGRASCRERVSIDV